MDKNIWEEFLDWDNKNKNDSSDVSPEKNIKIVMETSYCCHMSEYHYFIINRFEPLYFFIVKKGLNPFKIMLDKYLHKFWLEERLLIRVNRIFNYDDHDFIKCDKNEYTNGEYKLIKEIC
jgi:hypothetical protein